MQKPSYLKESASQTAGPYVHIGLAPGAAGFDIYARELGHDIAGPHAAGTRIRVEARVVDGTGSPVKDVLIEVWQANAAGHYAHPEGRGAVEDGFRGWGRVITDFATGEWGFVTVKPGAGMGRMGKMQAPHISFWLVARGINIGEAGRNQITGVVKRLDCNQYVRREAYADIEIAVLDNTSQQRFVRTYSASNVEGTLLSLSTGIFASVDDLRVLLEKTLRQAVDKALDDSALQAALQRQ